MSLFTPDYFILDYETGGFSGTRGFRPVEIAVLLFRGGKTTLRSTIINPYDDPDFQLSPDAEKVHGISEAEMRKNGRPAKEATEALHAYLNKPEHADLPIWAHNGAKFDFPLYNTEAGRYGLPMLKQSRLRDSAALYKGRIMGTKPQPGETLHAYFLRVLNTPRRGLLFNLKLIAETELIGLNRKDPNDPSSPLIADPSLGMSDETLEKLGSLGAHRAGYDVAVTHALVQTFVNNPYFKDFSRDA